MTDPLAPPPSFSPVTLASRQSDHMAPPSLGTLIAWSLTFGFFLALVGGGLTFGFNESCRDLDPETGQRILWLFWAFSAGWAFPMAAQFTFAMHWKFEADIRALAALIGVSCTGAIAGVILWDGPEILPWCLACLGASLLPWLEPLLARRLGFESALFARAFKKPTPARPLSAAAVTEILLGDAALLASFLLLLHAWDFFIPLVRAKTGVTLQPGSWFGVDLSIYLAIVINSFQTTFPRGQAYVCSLIVLGLSLSLGPILVFKAGPFQERFWWSFWVPMSFVLAVVAYRSVKKKGRDDPNEDAPDDAAHSARRGRQIRGG